MDTLWLWVLRSVTLTLKQLIRDIGRMKDQLWLWVLCSVYTNTKRTKSRKWNGMGGWRGRLVDMFYSKICDDFLTSIFTYYSRGQTFVMPLVLGVEFDIWFLGTNHFLEKTALFAPMISIFFLICQTVCIGLQTVELFSCMNDHYGLINCKLASVQILLSFNKFSLSIRPCVWVCMQFSDTSS